MPETPLTRSPFVSAGAVWGLAVFAFALLVRLIGIGWGLPNEMRNQSLHPDEPIIWMYSQRIEPTKGQFDPGFYNYGTLYLTILRLATDVVQGYGGGPTDRTPTAEWQAIGRYHLAGRIVSAVAGAGMAWVVFLILLRIGSLAAAGFGGAAMALAPGVVMHSRFQTVDVVAAFFLVLSLSYALKMLPREGESATVLRWAALAGLFAGLSAGVKYTGILGLVSLGIACLYLPREKRLPSLGLGLGVALLFFALSTPGIFLHSAKFFEDFSYEMRHTATGHGLVFAGTSVGFVYHLANLSAGMGAITMLIGLAGLVAGAIRRQPWAFVLGAFFLSYYVLIGRAEVKFFRYVIPLTPVLAVGFGWLVGKAHRSPNKRWRWMTIGGIVGLGGAASQTAVNTWWMASPDVRDEAGAYLKEKAGVGTVGLVADPWFQTPALYPDTALPRSVPFAQREAARLAATHPRVLRYVPENPDDRFDWDTRVLDERPDYVVYSSFEFDDPWRVQNMPGLDPVVRLQADRTKAFIDRLRREYEPLRVYGADGPSIHDLMYVRPRIWIWKRKTDSPPTSTGSSTTSSPSEEPANTR